jgi:alkyl sulfatase BDS1-like metallo-beta-lactamase superfamily hydrolase
MSNATLNNIAGYQSDNPDLMLTINRSDLETVMAGESTFDALLAGGKAAVEGDIGVLGQLAGLMVEFDPRFEIMPGTKLRTDIAETNPFEGEIGAMIPE